MKKMIALISLLLLLTSCSDSDEKESLKASTPNEIDEEVQNLTTINENATKMQLNQQSEEGLIDFEKSIETWNEEIEKWYQSSSMGAIEVIPVKKDYTQLTVIIHNNMKKFDNEDRVFIAEDITDDLQNLSGKIFNYKEEVQIKFEFQDSTSFLSE